PGTVLGRVDPDQEPATPETQVAYLGEQIQGFVRREVADARTRIEKCRGAVVEVRVKIECPREIGDDAGELDLGMRRGQPRQRWLYRGRGDVDGDEAPWPERRDPGLTLGAIASPQVDELPVLANDRGNRLTVRRVDPALGTRQVVFGQFADRIEQCAAERIVEVLRRNRRRW